jgi:hypothetical protein
MSACIDFVSKNCIFLGKGGVHKTRWVGDTGKVCRFSLVKVKELLTNVNPGLVVKSGQNLINVVQECPQRRSKDLQN